jgi:hypothetical protein
MRGSWVGMGALLLALVGCTTPGPNLKPTLHEEYNLPPADDPRFSQPITFPKETLNNNQFRRDTGAPGAPPAFRGGPGSGGMGTGAGMGTRRF